MFEMSWEMDANGHKGEAATNHIIHGIKGFQEELKNATVERLTQLILQTFEDIVNNFPVITGATVQDIHFADYGDGHLEIWTDNMVVFFIEYGTKGHGPKNSPFLVFKGKDGKMIRTKWVRGIDPHYIIENALDRLSQEVKAM